MNVYDIISEDKIINEAPTSGVGNAVKGLAGKLPGGERMAGSAEMGKEANELYKIKRRFCCCYHVSSNGMGGRSPCL